LATIDESINNSDTESIERITQTLSVGGENSPSTVAESSLLSEIVWDANRSTSRKGVDVKKDGVQRISAILNGSSDKRKLSPQQPVRNGVRFASVQVIEVEPSAQYRQNTPELERPKATPSSRRKSSNGSKSSDDYSRTVSKETLIPELKQLAQEDAEAGPCCLDLQAVYIPPSDSARRSSDTDTSLSSTEGSTTKSRWKLSPRKYRQCFIYLLVLLLLACSAALLTLTLKVVPANHGTSSTTTTNTTVSTPPTAPTALSTAAPTVAPVSVLSTAAPTVAPMADFNETRVREPLVFLNCGGPSVQVKSRVWESDRLQSDFIRGESRTKGHLTDPLCPEFAFSANMTNDDLTVVRNGDFSALFCSERYFTTQGGYEIPVPDSGPYRVELYFLEDFYSMSRKRVFNISLEDEVIQEDFDIFLRAGGAHLSTKLVTTKQVNDGVLSISLKASIGNPTINALAVYQIVQKQY
jgi:Malectin domain